MPPMQPDDTRVDQGGRPRTTGRYAAAVADPGLYVAPESAARPYAEAIAWLWRLGEPVHEPLAGAVGFGTGNESDSLARYVGEGRLAGAVVLINGEPVERPVRFEDGLRLRGPVLRLAHGGRAVVRSNAGIHGAERDRTLHLATTAERWGTLDAAWALPPLARYLARRLDRPLIALPPIGCLRIDDLPGTAELQLRGAARDDHSMERRIRHIVDDVERARAHLLVAVAARALLGEEAVPTDQVWPRAVAALADGVRRGVLEPAGHGLLHLNDAARRSGHLDPREFVALPEDEAGRRMDVAMHWIHDRIGPAKSFVPPAWGYNTGTLAAATARGLTVWLPPAVGALTVAGGHVRETLNVGIPSLDGLDYSPLRRIAEFGLPPTVVFHGRLLDDRLTSLRKSRALLSAARLARRRDLERIPRLPDIRWIAARDFLDRLRVHGSTELAATGISGPPGTEIFVLAEDGRRRVAL